MIGIFLVSSGLQLGGYQEAVLPYRERIIGDGVSTLSWRNTYGIVFGCKIGDGLEVFRE